MEKLKKKNRYEDKKWKDIFLVRAYELAKSGLKDSQIAEALGVSRVSFSKWKEDKPSLNDALRMGRANQLQHAKNGVERFMDYVYERLSPELKPLWDKIMEVHESESGYEQLRTMLDHAGEKARQNLFLHALVHYNFNPSAACRAVNISKSTLDKWSEDPDFTSLVREMQWHKKNLFEGQLVKLVMEGDPSAVIFANKTHNRDRGYNEKVEVEHKHEHSHMVAVTAVDVNKLPLEARKAMLEQLRERKMLAAPKDDDVEDAEVIEVKAQ